LIKHILLIFAGLLVLFWTLYLMVTPLAFPLGVVLFLITVVAGELLLSGDTKKLAYKSQSGSSKSTEFAMAAVFSLSLLIITLVPAIRGEIFVEWSALQVSNIARLIAAFGMTFLPG